MPLPKIMTPQFKFEVPSTKQILMIRPMVAREEKILLMAKESQDTTDIFIAIRQVCNNCILAEGFEVNSLSVFDLQMLFIKLRSISVSNELKLSYEDKEDSKQYDFSVNLDEVIVKWPEEKPANIVIDKDTYITLKYPSSGLFADKSFLEADQRQTVERIIKECVHEVVSKGTKTEFAGELPDEQDAFMESLPLKAMEDLTDYISKLPTVYYKIEYTNEKGTKRLIELTTLNDFFIWR